MKRICLLCALALSVLPVAMSAQENFFRALRENRVEMNLDYEFSQDGQSHRGKAVLTVQDSCFRLESQAMTVYCDGTKSVSVNSSTKEVVVEYAFDFDGDTEPADLLEALGVDTDKSDVNCTYDSFGMLSTIEASLSSGASLSVKVKSIKKHAKGDCSAFAFDYSALGPKWVVTDLRRL